MATLKTQATDTDPHSILQGLTETQQSDVEQLLKLLQSASGDVPVVWGKDIVGYGHYAYQYASGRSGEWFRIGFAARKQKHSIYIMCGFEGFEDELKQLGKHSLGKCCLYIKRLSDIDLDVLQAILVKAYKAFD